MQRLYTIALVVPMSVSFGLAAGELGGACVFKPRPVKAEAAHVKSWDTPPAPRGTEMRAGDMRGEEQEMPMHQEVRQERAPVRVQLVSEHRAPAVAEAHAAPTPAPSASAPQSPLLRNILTNEGVAMMAQAGYTERFIIDMIHRKQTRFDVSPAGLTWLAQMGLTERIVRAMVANERKEDDTTMVPAYLALPEMESGAGVRTKNGMTERGKARGGETQRAGLPVTIQAPSDYWYSRSSMQQR